MTQYNRFIPGGIPIDSTEIGRGNWLNRIQRGLRSQSNFSKIAQTAAFTAGIELFYPVDCTSGAITVTLPAANAVYSKHYIIKKIDSSANAITISPTGSDTIDGATSQTISTQWGTIFLASDGVSNWYEIAAGVGGSGMSLHTVELTGSSNWTPANGAGWYQVNATAAGGAGGGHTNNNSASGGGGGAGQEARNRWIYLTAAAVAYSVPGTSAGVSGNTTGTTGSDLTFATLRLKGGIGGSATGGGGGKGGGPNAAAAAAANADGPTGVIEADGESFSGAGGGGGAGGATNGGRGGTSDATDQNAAASNDGTRASSGGGASSSWGLGGAPVAPVATNSTAGNDGVGAGSGGSGVSGGTGNPTSGKGAAGRLIITYWA